LSFIGTFLAIDALIYNILNAAHFVLLLGLLRQVLNAKYRLWSQNLVGSIFAWTCKLEM